MTGKIPPSGSNHPSESLAASAEKPLVRAIPKSIIPTPKTMFPKPIDPRTVRVVRFPEGLARTVQKFVTRLRTAEAREELSNLLRKSGLAPTLELLDSQSSHAMERGKRYTSINPWPKEVDGEYLHIHRTVGKESSGLPVRGTLRDFMEPSLEKVISKGDVSYPVIDLLLMDKKDVPKEFLEEKSAIDDFYLNKLYFQITLPSGEAMLVTVPTARYTKRQFIVITSPKQPDILYLQHHLARARAEKHIETTSSGAKMVVGDPRMLLSPSERKAALKLVREHTEPSAHVVDNTADIEGMAAFTENLPPGSMVGQNSPDTSSDRLTKHFQVFLDVPDYIPIFKAEGTKFTGTDDTTVEKLDPAVFPGPVYRITSEKNNAAMRKYLKKIQDLLCDKEHSSTSLNLVVHKKRDGKYEFYFIPRKNMDESPSLRDAAEELGTNCPGWLEMCGVRLSKTPEDFTRVPDRTWRERILAPFTVSEEMQILIETALATDLPD